MKSWCVCESMAYWQIDFSYPQKWACHSRRVIKISAEMDIAERRRPQDGRFPADEDAGPARVFFASDVWRKSGHAYLGGAIQQRDP